MRRPPSSSRSRVPARRTSWRARAATARPRDRSPRARRDRRDAPRPSSRCSRSARTAMSLATPRSRHAAVRAVGAATVPDALRRAAPGLRALFGARASERAGRRRHGAAARAAHSRLRLRERRDAARHRSDPASPGKRSHRADHRRERHRQGPGGARDSRRVAARRRRCSSPTTAPARRASWPTASCSATAAAASPARSPISRA